VVFSATLAVAPLVISGGVVVGGSDRHRDGLTVGAALAVGHLDGHVVDVVAAGIRWRFEVRCGQEAQGARAAVDGELGGVGTANDAKTQVWAGWSESVAVTVMTAVVFSATLAVAPLVITGALSLAEVTVTAMA
jgi:hypothetical protein